MGGWLTIEIVQHKRAVLIDLPDKNPVLVARVMEQRSEVVAPDNVAVFAILAAEQHDQHALTLFRHT